MRTWHPKIDFKARSLRLEVLSVTWISIYSWVFSSYSPISNSLTSPYLERDTQARLLALCQTTVRTHGSLLVHRIWTDWELDCLNRPLSNMDETAQRAMSLPAQPLTDIPSSLQSIILSSIETPSQNSSVSNNQPESPESGRPRTPSKRLRRASAKARRLITEASADEVIPTKFKDFESS